VFFVYLGVMQWRRVTFARHGVLSGRSVAKTEAQRSRVVKRIKTLAENDFINNSTIKRWSNNYFDIL